MSETRDHGGALDAAIATFGGTRSEWIDLSTGINPIPYPISAISDDAWRALPDKAAEHRLIRAARAFWAVPDDADILPIHGASAAIARIPGLGSVGQVHIESPTYNEHAAAFRAAGWQVTANTAGARVIVHPNNPTGEYWNGKSYRNQLLIVDESFCDVVPEASHIKRANIPGTLVLKSFGKFWGLAGLRLGFVIGDPKLIARLREALGPWPVSGPALEIGARALSDFAWATATRARLAKEANRLDQLLSARGANVIGGTSLFRLYEVEDARHWHNTLAQQHILTRIFPYSDTWIRLGLPRPEQWVRLEAAL